jgi:hypothetical protein
MRDGPREQGGGAATWALWALLSGAPINYSSAFSCGQPAHQPQNRRPAGLLSTASCATYTISYTSYNLAYFGGSNTWLSACGADVNNPITQICAGGVYAVTALQVIYASGARAPGSAAG